jgi:hypothetical protein
VKLDTARNGRWSCRGPGYRSTPIFHIHVNPFLVTHVNGVTWTGPWQDTFALSKR